MCRTVGYADMFYLEGFHFPEEEHEPEEEQSACFELGLDLVALAGLEVVNL